MGPRERLERAQGLAASLSSESDPRDEFTHLVAGLAALRRETEAHLALHRRWDEVRDGRRLHVYAWPGIVVCTVLTASLWTEVARVNGILFVTAVLGSVDAVLWVRRAHRSRRLREEGGGMQDEPTP
jgi:hypothetical protein